MAPWAIYYGSWWMFQWSLDGTFSLGVHFDPRRRQWADHRVYGPYMDIHLGPFALSLGYQPARAWNHSLMRPELES